MKELIDNPDLPYEGVSFKDGYDEWCFPSDGHQKYVKDFREKPENPKLSEETWEWLKNYRRRLMRK